MSGLPFSSLTGRLWRRAGAGFRAGRGKGVAGRRRCGRVRGGEAAAWTGTRAPALLQRHIQDTLDLIEFANGPVTSKWGKLRAQMGHPKPFHLTHIEVGNEENLPVVR
ncbi:hypothetical protein, partial [Streptomyces acidiscabies]|uniref:hypothetical protein n=1 Tax=Streptomyces acidiscabies TaxID=42234 RepID=UPI000AC1FE49